MPKSKGKILKCLKVAIVDTVASDQSCIGKLFQIDVACMAWNVGMSQITVMNI